MFAAAMRGKTLLTDATYRLAAVRLAARDAIRAWKISPHWFTGHSTRDKASNTCGMRERLIIKACVSGRTFRQSLSVRLAHAVLIPRLGNESLLANVLHVVEVLHRVRPEALVHVNWILDGTEKGFRYGGVGSDVWAGLFASVGPRPNGRVVVAKTALDYAFWGSGKDYLRRQALRRHRRAYGPTLAKRIRIVNRRVHEEVNAIHERFRETFCVGVHKRVANVSVAKCQHDGAVPAIEQFLDGVRAEVRGSVAKDWRVFLATDDTEAVPAFRAAFGGRLIVRDECQRTTWRDTEVAFRAWGALSLRDAEDALIDTLLLARCSVLLHASSSITVIASLVNVDLRLVRVPGISANCARRQVADPDDSARVDQTGDCIESAE
jgi:nodulation protein Z